MISRQNALGVILVTGGAKGLGLGIVKQLLKNLEIGSRGSSAGIQLAIVAIGSSPRPSINPEFLLLQTTHPSTLFYLELDLSIAYISSSSSSLPSTSSNILQRLKLDIFAEQPRPIHLHALIHNAGILEIGKIKNLSLDAWRKCFEIKLFAGVGLVKDLLVSLDHDHTSRKPLVIFVSSGAASKAYDSWNSYCCANASLNMLASCLAKEEGHRVDFLSIRPGVIDTAMQLAIRTCEASLATPQHSSFVERFEKGQLLDPEVPGKVIALLALNGLPNSELSGQFLNWDDKQLLI